MSVKLRKKKISKGRISLYLDIYENGERRYDFLEIYLDKKESDEENAARLKKARQIRNNVDNQLLAAKRGVSDDSTLDICILLFLDSKYKGKKRERFDSLVSHLKEFTQLELIPFRMITKAWMLRFQAYLMDGERKENSVNTYMAQFNTILQKAFRDDIIPFNPWSKVDQDEKAKMIVPEVDPLEPNDIRLMLQNTEGINGQVRQCFTTSIFIGMRWGDASALLKSKIRRAIIEGKKCKVYPYRQEKTGKIKYMPLTSEVIRVLAERVLDERKEIHARIANGGKYEIRDEFFPRLIKQGESWAGYQFMRKNLLKWVKQAGVKKRVNFHLSRHTFATLMLIELKDIRIVSALLGHSKLQTTQRYAHVLDALKLDSLQRMSNYNLLG